MIIFRWLVSLVLAVGITLGLFYFMQSLIDTGDRVSQKVAVVRVVDATMPHFEPELVTKIVPPQPIDPPATEDPPPQRKAVVVGNSLGPVFKPTVTTGGTGPDTGQLDGMGDGDLLPLIIVSPQYPARAAQRGIEGWCTVRFTIDAQGNVVENSIVVVDAEPPDIFDRSSIRAAARFKYKPQVVYGEAMPVYGKQYRFHYRLED